MKRLTAFPALLLLLAIGCRQPRPEPEVVRLVDLAAAAESTWPRERPRSIPDEIEGLRTFRQLRKKKVGRVSMFVDGDGDNRSALVAPTGTRHRFGLVLPPDAQLRAGLGYWPNPEAEGEEVRFAVRLEVAEGSPAETVFEQALAVGADSGWSDIAVDLARWSGQSVKLELATIGEPSGPLVWAAWSAPEIVSATASEPGIDVILISLDTLRADRLGCYGYPIDTSPNLDRFAEQGVRFERAVSQAPWTLPSHRALFSGLYPTARDLDKSPTMAQALRRQGYRTEALTGGGQMDFRMGFAEGFDAYRVFDWIRNPDWLEDWLERSGGRKRFLFLHTYEVHDPYTHTQLAPAGQGGRVEGYFDKRTWFRHRGLLTPEEKEYVRALYDGGIAYTDSQLGMLFAMLEESGALERSIVIVTSDHGEQFWEHGSWRHGMNLYDHQLMVPLLVRVPPRLEEELAGTDGLTGKVIDQQVRLVDILPTVLDLLAIPLEHEINGRSLAPLLRGSALEPVDAFAENLNVEARESKALRTERYKFIYSFPKAKGRARGLQETRELFDLTRDPGELENLAERYPDEVAELDARLRTLLQLLADPDELDQEAPDLDPDLEQRLRALGYLGD